MTKPRYPSGCAAGSQVSGQASEPVPGNSDYAFVVGFNNGNVNNNHVDNNNYHARAVRGPVPRPGEYQHAQPVTLQDLHKAWRAARAGKKPSGNQLAFDARWIDGLLEREQSLNDGTWSPAPSTCFIAHKPKAREIHAPDFGDRVVHHWLVPKLERIFEPTFIHDSFSNRAGKGTHGAVDRLQDLVRQVHSGQGGGWYLQLDVRNFFNTIHRPTLWAMLKKRLMQARASVQVLRTTHALLRNPPSAAGIVYRCSRADRARVPAHKRLENAPLDRGLPIGNLSSQFFANVYLDALDQYVKHTLKAKRYVRYVDDFVLVHHDREQLLRWQADIERFINDKLHLALKPGSKLKPLTSGIDFLGYVVYPTHTRVRARVIHHARQKLHAWQSRHLTGNTVHTTPAQIREVRSTWASYLGHFKHANAWRLMDSFYRRFAWLAPVTQIRRRFDHRLEGKVIKQNVNQDP